MFGEIYLESIVMYGLSYRQTIFDFTTYLPFLCFIYSFYVQGVIVERYKIDKNIYNIQHCQPTS
jgi:hypothetical protein